MQLFEKNSIRLTLVWLFETIKEKSLQLSTSMIYCTYPLVAKVRGPVEVICLSKVLGVHFILEGDVIQVVTTLQTRGSLTKYVKKLLKYGVV